MEPANPPQSLFTFEAKALEERFEAMGGRAFHARIARREALERGVLDYAEMTGLPASLRERLEEELPLLAGREVHRTRAKDKTTKILIEYPARAPEGSSGPKGPPITVETVHMPSRKGNGRDEATLCVSTQAGCPVGCPFCASGLAGLERNLAAHEIIEQYLRGRALGSLSRSVVMGIGEPLLNADNLNAALAVVSDGMGLGARKITVSTVGFPERVARAARGNPRFELAISLHSAFDEERATLVPAMKNVPVEDVLGAGDDWFEVTGREVTYEVCLLGGLNDSLEHADRIVSRLRGRRGHVNLIPFNPVEESGFERPEPARVDAFCDHLQASGRTATVRWSRGLESDAACGQLRLSRSAAL